MKLKKHKLEITALTLLLGVLCYAFYDCNIKGSEQSFVLSNELLSMRKVSSNSSKEQTSVEMLALPTEDLLREQDEKKKEEELKKQEEELKKAEEAKKKEEEAKKKEEEAKKKEEETLEVTDKEVVSENQAYSINLAEEEETGVPYNEVVSNQIVNYALNFVGNPYVYGGNSLTNGTDCSGFTKLIFSNYGIYLPRSAPEQAYSGVSVGLDNIMPGDLVLSGYGGQVCHVAIYIGNGQLVHALNSDVGIVVTSLYIMPILDVRRVA